MYVSRQYCNATLFCASVACLYFLVIASCVVLGIFIINPMAICDQGLFVV